MSGPQYTNIHDVWTSRNLDALRRFLATTRRGGGAEDTHLAVARSPPGGHGYMHAAGTMATSAEVNRRDLKGRTLLHVLSAWEEEGRAMEWVRALDKHPGLQVNAVDAESGWTALHRALYNGNLGMARCLIDELGCDIHVKDHEGLTALDLWNASIEGTNPADRGGPDPARAELFTWGNNRNYVLGTASDGNRALPERVHLAGLPRPSTGPTAFRPANVSKVEMARLHTAVITAEGGLRTCGFGNGGRLGLGGGKSAQTQFALTEVSGIGQQVREVALGQDHTVVVTERGDVYTFGMNRFGQLGYSPEPGKAPTLEKEEIQSSPKRIVSVLKKEVVIGSAASRWHSAAFTGEALFTWGANHGQLGYAAAGTQIQYTPRRVTASLLTSPVRQLAATEYATVCLLQSLDLVVLYGDSVMRLAHPADRFPSAMQVYRPPQVSARSQIVKISASGDTLAAVSSLGDVFAWTFEQPRFGLSGEGGSNPTSIQAPKAQRIWSLRKKFTAVTDAAVGMDSSIILSTRSGHCFLRSRRLETSSGTRGVELRAPQGGSSGKKAFKFYRIPYLQRVINVAANPTGAFAVVRSDVRLKSIEITGDTLAESLAGILPHLRRYGGMLPVLLDIDSNDREGDEDDTTGQLDGDSLDKDIRVASALISIHTVWDDTWTERAAGSDASIVTKEHRVPAHRVVLAARSPAISEALRKGGATWLHVASGGAVLHLDAFSHFAILLLLHYIYTDDLPAVWDPRVASTLADLHPTFDLAIAQTKSELLELARLFDLPELARVLALHGKRSPKATLREHFGEHFDSLTGLLGCPAPPPWQADVILELADREVHCHSTVLRARCPFFAMMYEQEAWTVNRRVGGEGTPEGVVRIDIKHLKWMVVALVLRHIYTDAGAEIFDAIEMPSPDAFIEFTVQVLAAADELLLDKLKLICSAVLRRFVTLHNVVSILADTDFYQADALREACMDYIACSLETMLEAQMLQNMPTSLMKALSAFAKERQLRRAPTSRSSDRMTALMIKYADYLADVDLPTPTVGMPPRRWKPLSRSPGPSPASPGILAGPAPRLPSSLTSPTMATTSGVASPSMSVLPSPSLSPALAPVAEDDGPFVMDDLEENLPSASGSSRRPSAGRLPSQRTSPWAFVTPSKIPPLDLRSILPASAAEKRPSVGPSASQPRMPSDVFGRQRLATPARRSSHGSPDTFVPISPPTAAGWQSNTPSTWRASEAAKVSLAAVQQEQSAASKTTTPSRPSPSPAQGLNSDSWRASRPSAGSSPSLLTKSAPRSVSTPLSTQRSADPASAVGAEIITPSRGANSAGRSRSSMPGQDVPWVNYSSTTSAKISTTPTQHVIVSSTTATASFAQIQSQQHDEGLAIRNKLGERPSFADIQHEEQLKEADRKAEQAFLRWFEEESARTSRETSLQTGANRGAGKQKDHGGGKGRRGERKASAEQSENTALTSTGGRKPSKEPAENLNAPASGRGRGRGGRGGGGKASGRGRGGNGRSGSSAPPPQPTHPTSATTVTTLSTAAPAFFPRTSH